MEMKLLKARRYITIGKKIRIGTKDEIVNADDNFVKCLPQADYETIDVQKESKPSEKPLSRMNWLELAQKALELQLIESIQKAQDDKLTKAQLIDIIQA